MKLGILKKSFSGVIACMSYFTLCAQEVTLNQSILMAQKKSVEYLVANNNLLLSRWNFQTFKASLLPKISLSSTLPNYINSITKITLPSGDDTFVSQNQAFTSVDLAMKQNLLLTGGTLSISSTLNRIDVLGNSRSTRYSTIPASISYYQNGIGYNDFKWQKKIEPLKLEVAQREFISSMENIAANTVFLYFQRLSSQIKYRLSKQNLSNFQSLLKISKERFKLGAVTKSELLQLELNIISTQNMVIRDSVDMKLALQNLAKYIGLSNPERYISEVLTSYHLDQYLIQFVF